MFTVYVNSYCLGSHVHEKPGNIREFENWFPGHGKVRNFYRKVSVPVVLYEIWKFSWPHGGSTLLFVVIS